MKNKILISIAVVAVGCLATGLANVNLNEDLSILLTFPSAIWLAIFMYVNKKTFAKLLAKIVKRVTLKTKKVKA